MLFFQQREYFEKDTKEVFFLMRIIRKFKRMSGNVLPEEIELYILSYIL